MTHRLRRVLPRGLAIVVAISLLVTTVVAMHAPTQKAYAAAANDVIINEIMYNPGTGNQNDEFLELYNTTGSDIDLGGWSFSAGITLTFLPGTIITSHGYIVISPDTAQTMTTYGVLAVAQYAPSNLSNGGETVSLIDDSLNVIDSVAYDDVSPWPTSPDGNGTSLELKGTGLDNSDPTNWGASVANGGTPLAQNSQVGLNLPTVTGVNDPNDITASQAVDIVATVTGTGITSVELKYKLNFDADVTLTMYDDGAHNDGSAGDTVYGAQIPGQAEKTLVRFRVEATNGSGTQSSPNADDSMHYNGYYIKDSSLNSNVPVIEWFISDADYADMHTNHVFDNVYLNCVVVLGNDVYDNSKVRIKGEISRLYPKKQYKFKLPAGYKIDVPGGSSRKTNEFHMNAEFQAGTMGQTFAAWWAIEQSGMPTPDYLVTRLQKNGEFEGTYTYFEKYEQEWRDQYGYTNGELYEDYTDIVFGANDYSSIQSWRDSMGVDHKDPAKRDYILDNNDIPNITNYMSIMAVLSSWDHFLMTNTFSYKSGTTGRWSHLYWDLSSSFSSDGNKAHYPSPYDHDQGPDQYSRVSEFALYSQPDLREAYFRRLRTLADKFYSGDELASKFQEFEVQYNTEMQQDFVKWPEDPQNGYGRPNYQTGFAYVLKEIKRHLLVLHRQSWAIPPAQTDADRESVSISEIVADANNANEYIKLTNSANTAVDISGWTIEGIDYALPAGAVIPSNSSMYVLRDDINYRTGHSSVLVAGQYSTDLGSSGTLTLKTDAGATIDTRSY